MKQLKTFGLFVLISSFIHYICASSSTKSLSKAFGFITKEFSRSRKEVPVYIIGSDADAIDSVVLKNLRLENFPVKITNQKAFTKRDKKQVNNSAILTFDTVKSLKTFNNEVYLANQFPKNFTFYVYCQQATFTEIVKLRDTTIVPFQYFVVEEKYHVKLLTFVWYQHINSRVNCNKTALVEINSFTKKTQKWKKKTFLIEKFRNFQNCQLTFGVAEQVPANSFGIFNDTSAWYFGYQITMIDGLRSHLNYTADYNPYQEESFFFRNRRVEFVIQPSRIGDMEQSVFGLFVTRPFRFENNYFLIPPGADYSTYDKLILPFDSTTWYMIILVFVVSFSTIFVLKFTTPKLRNFIIGADVPSPTLNVVAAFFGISLLTLPAKSYPRYFSMVLILFSLIIRTCWQGKMFEFMNQNMTKPEVQSIQEMIEKNFTFFIRDGEVDRYSEMLGK
jgi:hypothetical protein